MGICYILVKKLYRHIVPSQCKILLKIIKRKIESNNSQVQIKKTIKH